jgi:hypothetical protein
MWLEQQYRAAAVGRPDIEIEIFEHTWEQPSLIVKILGKGANRAETVLHSLPSLLLECARDGAALIALSFVCSLLFNA